MKYVLAEKCKSQKEKKLDSENTYQNPEEPIFEVSRPCRLWSIKGWRF